MNAVVAMVLFLIVRTTIILGGGKIDQWNFIRLVSIRNSLLGVGGSHDLTNMIMKT